MKFRFLAAATAAVFFAGGAGVAHADKGDASFVLTSRDGTRIAQLPSVAPGARRAGSRGVVPSVGLPVAGITTNATYGDPANTVIEVNIGANNQVLGVSFDVRVDAFDPSWQSESRVDFGDSAGVDGVALTPATGVNAFGSAEYSSGGIVDLVDLSLDFPVGPDGILRFEFYESFDDSSVNPDAEWYDHISPAVVSGLAFVCSDQAACDAAFGALGGPKSNLSITKTAPGGVVAGGNFTYQLAVANAGPDDEPNAVVTDVLPAGITFVSSTCGATAAGGTVTWNVGALANGANASCTLTVNQASAVCSVVSNTATIAGDNTDSSSGNNSSTASNQGANPVADPSFELGGAWTDNSDAFSTVICDVAGCGTGSGTGPRTGDLWVWFGGLSSGPEAGYAEQSVTIPAGVSTLSFWAEQMVCNAANGAGDYLALLIDGTEVWRTDATDAACGTLGYREVTLPIGAYADGAAHMIRFESETLGNGGVSNFFIDDVTMSGAPVCSGAPNISLDVPSLNVGAASFLTIANTGTASGTVGAPVFTGPFALGPGGTCPAAPFPLAAGSSCTFQIVLTTTAPGSYAGNVTVDGAGTPLTASLTANVQAPRPAFIPATGTWALGLMIGLMGLFAGAMVIRRQG